MWLILDWKTLRKHYKRLHKSTSHWLSRCQVVLTRWPVIKFKVLSKFEFLSFVRIKKKVLSQFEFYILDFFKKYFFIKILVLKFVAILVFEFSHYFEFWSQVDRQTVSWWLHFHLSSLVLFLHKVLLTCKILDTKQIFGIFWCRCHLHSSRDLVSPICGIFDSVFTIFLYAF